MDLDVDTFLTTVYCVCDDLYRAEIAPQLGTRPGAKPQLSDSEVLTLAALAQWAPQRCERCFLRYARTHWQAYFPRLTSQSAFNRRVRNLWGALSLLGPALARALHTALRQEPAYEVWDGVPIPLMRRCRGGRHHLFAGEAGFGRGGSDQEWYYGMHQLTAVSAAGPITGFVVGPADTAEYWLAEALLRWRRAPRAPAPTAAQLAPVLGAPHGAGGARRGPTGSLGPRPGVGVPAQGPYICDLGCTGRAWRAHWQADYGAVVLTRADYDGVPAPAERTAWTRWLCGLRQTVETVFHVLTDQFGAKFPRARSRWGVWTRLAAKVVAFNLMLYVNHRFGRPTFAMFNPLL